jgi:hypothetical protein
MFILAYYYTMETLRSRYHLEIYSGGCKLGEGERFYYRTPITSCK